MKLGKTESGHQAGSGGSPYSGVVRLILPAMLFLIIALLLLAPYAPYYYSYYNPLLGGAYTAPNLVKIGWGEGLDQVGRFLQRELKDSRVGTAYASTVAPYFKGDLSGVTGQKLDYLVLYRKQVQSGEPSPAFVRYFEQAGSLFSVELNGIHYADVYRGPALQPALNLSDNDDNTGPSRPTGFRPLTPYGQAGQPLDVDVIWPANTSLPAEPAMVTLAPIDSIAALQQGPESEALAKIQSAEPSGVEIARGQGQLERVAPELVVSRHRLLLPEALERGTYALLVDDRPLGDIEVRRFNVPDSLGAVQNVVFDQQIALAGYRFRPTEDYISVTVAWQAATSRLPDYTVFAQLLNVDTNERVAGFDTQPEKGEWPTSRWAKGEVVVDEYLVAIPPDLEPGFYIMIVGLYQPETGQRLLRANGQDHWMLPFTFIWE